MTDRSFVHLALRVADLDASVLFYTRYTSMQVVLQRRDKGGGRTAWLHDVDRDFVLVLAELGRLSMPMMLLRKVAQKIARFVSRPAHLGIPCESREAVDEICREARSEGRLVVPPNDAGPIVGYYAMLVDPDGHNLELSYGQEVGVKEGREAEGAHEA